MPQPIISNNTKDFKEEEIPPPKTEADSSAIDEDNGDYLPPANEIEAGTLSIPLFDKNPIIYSQEELYVSINKQGKKISSLEEVLEPQESSEAGKKLPKGDNYKISDQIDPQTAALAEYVVRKSGLKKFYAYGIPRLEPIQQAYLQIGDPSAVVAAWRQSALNSNKLLKLKNLISLSLQWLPYGLRPFTVDEMFRFTNFTRIYTAKKNAMYCLVLSAVIFLIFPTMKVAGVFRHSYDFDQGHPWILSNQEQINLEEDTKLVSLNKDESGATIIIPVSDKSIITSLYIKDANELKNHRNVGQNISLNSPPTKGLSNIDSSNIIASLYGSINDNAVEIEPRMARLNGDIVPLPSTKLSLEFNTASISQKSHINQIVQTEKPNLSSTVSKTQAKSDISQFIKISDSIIAFDGWVDNAKLRSRLLSIGNREKNTIPVSSSNNATTNYHFTNDMTLDDALAHLSKLRSDISNGKRINALVETSSAGSEPVYVWLLRKSQDIEQKSKSVQ